MKDEKGAGSGWIAAGVAAILGGAIGAFGMASLGGAGLDKARMEGVVRDYLLENPEVLPEAMDRLRTKQSAELVGEHRKALETAYAGAWMGAADGDVVLVEFTDYNCGYCRASLAVVDRLVAEDKKLKVVFRELPILSEASDTAARAALAAAAQNKYPAFHAALFKGGQVSDASIAAAQNAAGVDAGTAQAHAESAAVTAEIEANHDLARKLGFSGTPSWVVGDQVLQGAVGYEALKKAIAEVRAAQR